MNLRLSGIAWTLVPLIIVTGLIFYLVSQSAQQSDDSKLQKGMAFPTWDSGQYGTASSDESLRILAETTCTEWVQLVPTWYQNDRFSNRMFPDYDGQTASMESLKHAIQMSHLLGLKVMLKPHIDAFSGDWRGTFQPEDSGIWFDNYMDMMMTFAHIAQDEGVEILSLGCEFVELTTAEYSPDWRRVIQAIRSVYTGWLF